MPFAKGQPSANPNGRPKGSVGARVLEREQKLREITARLGYDIEGGPQFDAHALLVAAYRHPDLPIDIRLDAAKAAIKFEKPALSAGSVSGEVHHSFSIADQLSRATRRLLQLDGKSAAAPCTLEAEAREIIDGVVPDGPLRVRVAEASP